MPGIALPQCLHGGLPMRCSLRALIMAASIGFTSPAIAQTLASAQLPALKQLTLEELLEVSVALPSRREDRVFDAPTAISVLTSEDIRRSGAVSLPETLRFVPGLFAARVNTSGWVVTSRGFAMTSANKLLVMIDGRTVYSPLFSGVFWELQDAVLQDLDRIEVVRGPGATLWGSNAVNGVINVVSKNARDTQGTLITGGTGAEEHGFVSVRHGGTAGSGHYRIYGKYFDRDDAKLDSADGEAARDGQRFGLGGFRLDLGAGANALTVQGDVFASRTGFADRDDIENNGANVLARWTRQFSPRAEFQAQFYYDRTSRLAPLQFEESRHTVDVDLQQRWDPSPRSVLTVGGGYRVSSDDTTETPLLFFVPEDRTTRLVNVFVQHELAMTRQLTTVIGGKVESNDYTGSEFQPTGRVRWALTPSHLVWGAVSRAVRLPTRLETDVRVKGPTGAVSITGNPDFKSEQLVAYELGYRTAFRGLVALDVASFRNRYDNLRTQEFVPQQPVRVGNGLNAKSSGIELTATVQPRPWSRLTGAYAYLTHTLTLDATSRDLTQGLREAIDPAHQLWFQSRLDLRRSVEFDLSVRHVSALPAPGTPAYTEAGFRVGWRLSPQFEIALVGRDFLHAAHLEFVSPSAARRTASERAVFIRATLAF